MFKLAWRSPYVGMAGAGENWNGLGGALGGRTEVHGWVCGRGEGEGQFGIC